MNLAARTPTAIFKTEEKAAATLAAMNLGDDYRVHAYGTRFVIAYFEDGVFYGYL
jgi:hypothetical protein